MLRYSHGARIRDKGNIVLVFYRSVVVNFEPGRFVTKRDGVTIDEIIEGKVI